MKGGSTDGSVNRFLLGLLWQHCKGSNDYLFTNFCTDWLSGCGLAHITCGHTGSD